MKRQRTAWIAVATAAVMVLVTTGTTQAKTDPEKRCTRAATAARSRILHTDSKLLARCAIAVRFAKPAGETEEICSRLRTRGEGADLSDHRARTRILKRCTGARPSWLADRCPGPGMWTGLSTIALDDFATCMTSSAHCLALDAIEPLVGRLEESAGMQHPQNLNFDFGTRTGNSFAACKAAIPTTTMPETTTTTVEEPLPTTTLVDPDPTTTSTTTTLSAPDPTTSTTTTTVVGVPTGNFVITEFMSNPAAQSDTTGEYFELKNVGTTAANLEGAVLRDEGSNAFTIQEPLVVAAGDYVVLGKTETAAGGLVDYVYGSGMSLSNSGDEIILEIGGNVIDIVAYDGTFPLESGVAAEVSPSAEDSTANDAGENWCAAGTDLGDGDSGSPGSAATGCTP
jgi:hypothetical protein